jgi:EmrB/QacA subfamily drug resistance transporter
MVQHSTVDTATGTDRKRWLALLALCSGFLMIILDQTVVNVALPSIQTDLGFSQAGLAWVINAYLIAFGGLLLLAGRFGDLIGRKNMFLGGLGVFTVASMLCGVSQSAGMLVVARFIQGAGGALTSAVILGVIVSMFTEQREQAKAIGVYSGVAAGGAAIGLLAGGVLTTALNWHWIFFVNLPIGIGAAILAHRVVDRDEGIGLREGADVLGALLVTSSLMLGVYTIVEVPVYGWGSLHSIGLGALAVALFAGFILRQIQAAKPLMPLGIFKSRNVSGANLIQIFTIAGLFGMFFLGALYLKEILGYGPMEIGLGFLPVALLIGGMSFSVAAKLAERFGPRTMLIIGLVLIFAGLLLFARIPVDGQYVRDVLPSMLLIGLGAGIMFAPLMTLAMSGATEHDAGLASGVVNTTQQVGGALGLAVLATLSATRTSDMVAAGESQVSALTSGYQLAFGIGAVFVAVAVIVAATVLRNPAPQAQESDEEEVLVPATQEA